uniref:Alpha/beta hydrolase fold-3 domain-containing protein n=1 Tax=Oryza barthii TaxID=65489 RepID=A0A0D3GML0_9ORYZ
MAMASSTPAPYVVEDCGLNLQLLSDGTVNTLPPVPELRHPRCPPSRGRTSSTTPAAASSCGLGTYELPAVVLSADYRLPAAHGDAATVMSLVRDQVVATGDPWLSESSADFGRVFVSGDQASRLALPQLG